MGHHRGHPVDAAPTRPAPPRRTGGAAPAIAPQCQRGRAGPALRHPPAACAQRGGTAAAARVVRVRLAPSLPGAPVNNSFLRRAGRTQLLYAFCSNFASTRLMPLGMCWRYRGVNSSFHRPPRILVGTYTRTYAPNTRVPHAAPRAQPPGLCSVPAGT